MSERFDPAKLSTPRRRKERVDLDAGPVWVWELMVPEMTTLAERSARPKIDPRGGLDPTEAALWQIVLSCYYGEEEDAERIFSERDMPLIYKLRMEEFKRLMEAINRVNGQSATEAEILRGFTAALRDEESSPSNCTAPGSSSVSPAR